MTATPLAPADFRTPAVLLAGEVGYPMYESFHDQPAKAPTDGLVIVELATLGGDLEVARMMGEDIRFHSDLDPARRFVFWAGRQSIRPARPS